MFSSKKIMNTIFFLQVYKKNESHENSFANITDDDGIKPCCFESECVALKYFQNL